MTQKIEITNLTPIISTISSGKSSFLNIILNIDFLQVTSGIGTKNVNIIRYNPNVGNNPKFYHLFVKKEGNKEDYQFFKEIETEIEGKINIKNKIIEINENLKKKDSPFEDIFYMIEIGEAGTIDEEYLKNYDLVDIPGLSEYIPSKDNKNMTPLEINKKKSYSEKKDINYINGIFGIIKNKIKNGIILFDCCRIRQESSYNIIKEFYKVINKEIINYLILLNKIDLSENKLEDIKILESQILKACPNGDFFNFTNNTLVPCSTFQLENEMKMGKSFRHLIYYHFDSFVNKKRINKTDNDSFIDYLKNKISIIKNTKFLEKETVIDQMEKFIKRNNLSEILNEIKDAIGNIKEKNKVYNLHLGIDENDFDEKKIKEIPNNLKNDDDEDDDDSDGDDDDSSENENTKKKAKILTLEFEELDGNIIILLYYNSFIKGDPKFIPPISKDNQKIINYFTMKNITKKIYENEDIKKNLDKITIKNIEITLNKLSKFCSYQNKYINKNDVLIQRYINSSIINLKNSKYFYIPIIGLNNVGKSTILNSLIGYQLLPNNNSETTKKGILIKYWNKDYPIIYKTHFKIDNGIYYFKSENRYLATGTKNVMKILNGVNNDFSNDVDDFFYEINTKIKFVDEFNFGNKLKDQI